MNDSMKIPVWLKLSQILLGIIALFYVLYIGKDIIIPLLFSFIIAILLNPVVNYLVRKKINRVVAILLTILFAILALAGLFYFLTSQIMGFSDMMPQLIEKINTLLTQGTEWISETFNIKTDKLNVWFSQMRDEGLTVGKSLIGPTIISLGGLIVVSLLLPVYIFMILFYKKLLLEFISRLFTKENHSTVGEILYESKSLIQSYLVGLLLETGIVAALNTTGLLILGIKYAVLLGLISAILNIIPYLGGIIAMILIMIVVLALESPIYALWIVILFLFVQFIDNNFLMPKIVGSKVKINEFIAILAILVGGALWGIAGMFLSLPIIAILKVIFDRIEPLKPFGLLLGSYDSREEIKILKYLKKKTPRKT